MSPSRSNLATANDQGLLKVKNQGNYSFLLRVLALKGIKGHSPVQFYLRDTSHIFKILILPNVRSTVNVKKDNTNL